MSTLTMIVFVLWSVLFYKFVDWFLKRKEFFKKIEYLPGPKGFPLIGNALDIKGCQDLLPVLMKNQGTYGLTYRYQLGPDPYVFTSDPKLMEALTSSSTQITKSKSYKFLKNWLGDGLVSAANPRWRAHRRLITPSFHFNVLKDFVPVFLKNELNLVDQWKRTIGKGNIKLFDVYEDISSCALDIICETSMGVSINALKDGKHSKYMDAVRHLGRTVIERTFSIWLQFDFLYKYSHWYKNEVTSVAEIKRITRNVIKSKRAEVQANGKVKTASINDENDIGAKKRLAFLDFMIGAEKENGSVMTDEELSEEVDTIIFAGHDTTATTSAYVLYYLACNPDIQQKLYDEVITMPVNEVTYDNLLNLKYLEMVLKETMRIQPTVPMIFRELNDDVVFNGHHFPKGLNIACFIYGSHLNPELFEEPEKFKPERFSTENMNTRHAFAYLPFSAGPRNCIGQKFAMIEMKSMVSMLVRNFKFSKAAGVDIKPIAEGITKSENGVQLLVEIRP